jgi:hypothetical protein
VSLARFALTFEVVTEASAEDGDVSERDYLTAEPVRLRDARREFGPRTAHCETVCTEGDSRTVRETYREFLTGAAYTVCLHIPATVTESSARRIARLFGATIQPAFLRAQA